MANRYAPYKQRWMAREPKAVVAKFTANSTASTEQTLVNTGPFNGGIVNVTTTGTAGHLLVYLGTSDSSRDKYSFLSGVDFVADVNNIVYSHVHEDNADDDTNPTVTLAFRQLSDGTNTAITTGTNCVLTLYFIDSKD